jgi:hypothetical protein
VIAELDSAADEGMPTLSSDELVIYFARRNPTTYDTFRATRTDAGAMFGSVVAVTELNMANVDDAPTWLSPDGCRLYLESSRSGNFDIYVAER